MAKVAVNIVLILLPIIDFIYDLIAKPNGVYYLSACVRIVSSVVALLLLLYCRRKGLVAPDGIFYYWLIDSVFLAITFRLNCVNTILSNT